MNKTEVTYMDVDSLLPYADSPRLDDNAVDAAAASIEEFGLKVPIVAPQAVKVAETGAHHRRMHHRVDWNRCVPKTIGGRYGKRR